MTEPRYHINVFWSSRENCWLADIPDLVSCSAQGDSPLGALAEVEIAMALWLETARDGNLPIPDARYDWKTQHLA